MFERSKQPTRTKHFKDVLIYHAYQVTKTENVCAKQATVKQHTIWVVGSTIIQLIEGM